ncbi:hypothetical protein C0993_003698 [Termitomyces sp. T159_Od127]|nr:hypothetical protein C0993_003698 [Termitomyces sp. T159_Od127]
MSLQKGNVGKSVEELVVVSENGHFESDNLHDDQHEHDMDRKSPAARYGSRQIGAVILPNQLQNAINAIESDKVQLHSDAKRLFFDEEETDAEGVWTTHYSPKDYRSQKQASRHSGRDGAAFATIALPAHYSAVLTVLDHVKRRLEPSWKVERVIDWGAGTGSGLWAALHTFQNSKQPAGTNNPENKIVANSSVVNYLGIDKREGLVTIAKRLFEGIDVGNLSLRWQKSFKEVDQVPRSQGHDTVALSSFMLTSLPTAQHRKALVKEMWESGAHLMVLIDHSTNAGFEAIAEAREYLLNMGRKEFDDIETKEWPIRGSHVVAPCPHDGVCPLHHPGSTRLVCGFSQRIQRPSFVRKTKHSGVGHEDIDYSYVVIRRGQRPVPSISNVGRIGEVGRRASEKEALSAATIKELKLDSEHELSADETHVAATNQLNTETENTHLTPEELEEALRLESYSWPRLVFTPLKKSGHIILDSCSPEAKILRMTIPRSQGKQAFYDARKASWGDLFPHPPKNPPQDYYQPTRAKREGGTTPVRGSDIGKRKRNNNHVSYEALSKDLKEARKKSSRHRGPKFSDVDF